MFKRGQAWSLDLMVASILFIMGIVIFYLYAESSSNLNNRNLDNIRYESKTIGDIIFSEGYPENWSKTNVVRIGIITNNQLDETKVLEFYNLSKTNYDDTKNIFKTTYNYYLNFSENLIINNQTIEGIGYLNSSSKNIFKTTRLTSYNNKLINVHLYLWI